jgi:peroxiredoxin
MRCVVMLVVACFALPAYTADPTPAEKLKAIREKYEKLEKSCYAVYGPLNENLIGMAIYDMVFKVQEAGQKQAFADAFALAQAEPQSEVALSAVEWILTTPRSYYLPIGKPAFEFVREHYVTSPKIGNILNMSGYYPPHDESIESYTPLWKLMAEVIEKNTDRTVKAQAYMAQAWKAKRDYDFAAYKNDPKAESLALEAEKKFDIVLKDYADCKRATRDQKPLGEIAEAELFEIRYLRVGKPAIATAGQDLDGVKFQLSDYKGKVVVLVFWASWCGPCMREVPHEIELVTAMKDKPFALIGVNGDETLEAAQKCVKANDINFRSFFNGGAKRDKGMITAAWNVRAWPTVYVLDAQGTIRYKHLRGDSVDKAVNELLKEMKTPSEAQRQ